MSEAQDFGLSNYTNGIPFIETEAVGEQLAVSALFLGRREEETGTLLWLS